MDNKIKEIEERWIRIEHSYERDPIIHINPDIKYLLSRIKDLDKTLINQMAVTGELKVYLNNAQQRIKGLEDEIEELSELKEAIRNAQMENPNEVHCSCVPLLRARIHQLEIELAEQKSLIPWIGELAQAKVKIKELEKAL